jgi:hypothetical protein
LLAAGFKLRLEDADVGAPFHGAAEPHACESTIWQQREIRGMGLNAGRRQIGHDALGVLRVFM